MPFALRADKHFLQVECEEAEPETVEEVVEQRLGRARETEQAPRRQSRRQNRNVPPEDGE